MFKCLNPHQSGVGSALLRALSTLHDCRAPQLYNQLSPDPGVQVVQVNVVKDFLSEAKRCASSSNNRHVNGGKPQTKRTSKGLKRRGSIRDGLASKGSNHLKQRKSESKGSASEQAWGKSVRRVTNNHLPQLS